MKLTDILNEASYERMKINDEEAKKGMTNEEKREFLKAVSEYKKFGESIYRAGNLAEVYESVKGIVETAHKVTLEETGDWFDKVTVGRHMKSMNESFKVFEKTISEVNTLQQRLESAYDEMGEVLGKYYEIKEGNEFGAERAKAIAKGDDEFEVDGKKFPVKDVDKEDKENAKDFAKESVNEEEKSMKLTDILSENKYSIIDPKGNQKGVGPKDAANKMQKKLGGSKKGYFVVPAKFALKARRAMEKYKFDFKNPKLQDMMSDLYFEGVEESVNEAQLQRSEVSKLQKGLERVLGTSVNIDINSAGAHEFYINNAKFMIGIGDGIDRGTKFSFDIYDDGAIKTLVSGKSDNINDLIKQIISVAKKHKKSLLQTESLNEGASTEEKRIVMLAVRKIAKLRNVPINQSVVDVQRAADELERDIQKGKVKK